MMRLVLRILPFDRTLSDFQYILYVKKSYYYLFYVEKPLTLLTHLHKFPIGKQIETSIHHENGNFYSFYK